MYYVTMLNDQWHSFVLQFFYAGVFQLAMSSFDKCLCQYGRNITSTYDIDIIHNITTTSIK